MRVRDVGEYVDAHSQRGRHVLPYGLEHRVISFNLGSHRPQGPGELESVVDRLDPCVRFTRLPGGVDGVTRYEHGRVVIELSPEMSEARTSFTLAHELGHVLVDRWRERSPAPGYLPTDARDVELLCDRIASELLMPQGWAKAEASTLSAPWLAGVRQFADKAGVTTTAAATRLTHLGVPLAWWELWRRSSPSGGTAWDVVRARGRHHGCVPPATVLHRLKAMSGRQVVALETRDAVIGWRLFDGPSAYISGQFAIIVACRRPDNG